MSDKQRWPLDQAKEVALEIEAALVCACERVIVAGSIRRRKATVGDIELLYIPRFVERQIDFFNTEQANMADVAIHILLADGVIAKRTNVNGSEMWGEKNKLAVHVATGIPIDLFSTTHQAWQAGCREKNQPKMPLMIRASLGF